MPAFGEITVITHLPCIRKFDCILGEMDSKVTQPDETLPHSPTWVHHLSKAFSVIFLGFAWVQCPGSAISQISCCFTFTVDVGFSPFGLRQAIQNNFTPLPLSGLCSQVSDIVQCGGKAPKDHFQGLESRFPHRSILLMNHSTHLEMRVHESWSFLEMTLHISHIGTKGNHYFLPVVPQCLTR